MNLAWLQEFLIETVLGEIIVVVMGVLVAHVIMGAYRSWRFGRWTVVIHEGDDVLLDRSISPSKAKQLLDDEADLSVYLKGVVSPYAWLHRDLLDPKSLEEGMLIIDETTRTYHIDLGKNPPAKHRTAEHDPATSTREG